MSYSQPRDRLELRLKEIIDDQIGDVTDRRTRFDALLAAVVDPSVVPPDQRDRAELYLSELAGRAGGGVTPTGTVNITANGTHNVSQYEYANVQVPAGGPDMAQLELMLGAVSAAGTYTPPAGYAYDEVRIAQDSTVITPGNIKKDVTILGVTGTYEGTSGLTYDVQTVTPPIGVLSPVAFNIGWRPDVIVFDWSEEDGDDPSITHYYRKALTADGSIESGNDTVTFTSTGYTVMMDGTYWNDPPERFGPMTITAIQL